MKEKRTRREKKVASSILTGARQAMEHATTGNLDNVTVRTAIVTPITPHYKPKEIKAIRERFSFSQAVFAQVMGVSKKTVEAWEAGSREPSGSAKRLLDLIVREEEFLTRNHVIEIA